MLALPLLICVNLSGCDDTPDADTHQSGEAGVESAGAGEESAGEESAGEESAGEESAGEESAGEESAGEESAGEESAGEESAGEESAGEESASAESAGEESAGEESAGTEPEPELNKSFKRGVASAFPSAADLGALAPGISWWYNWSPDYHRGNDVVRAEHPVEFLPMTWNGNNPDQIRAFLDEHPEVRYLLTYNEPNFQDQANLTPAYAASIWPTFEAIAEEYDVELVGPAVNYCGGCVVVDGAPIGSPFTIWMDMFFDEYRAQFGREPRMDYTALHWYDFGLEDQVNEMIMRYNKPVWLTEFALWRGEEWCTDEFERDWMLDMVAFLEAHPMVYRYSWFTGRRPDFPKINLLNAEGELTPLGEAYVNAPY